MGHDLHGYVLALRDCPQQREPVDADRMIDRDVFRRDGVGLVPGGVRALRFRKADDDAAERGRAPTAN